MAISSLAGKPAPADLLIDATSSERDYYDRKPDLSDPAQLVSFRHQRPSRHAARRQLSPKPTSSRSPRPSAITARRKASTGRCSWARTRTPSPRRPAHRARSACRQWCRDPHPAQRRLHAHARHLARHPHLQRRAARRPSPTASSSPLRTIRPRDGGFKYNPPNGGPADTDVTGWIQNRANELLRDGNRDVKRMPYEQPLQSRHHA